MDAEAHPAQLSESKSQPQMRMLIRDNTSQKYLIISSIDDFPRQLSIVVKDLNLLNDDDLEGLFNEIHNAAFLEGQQSMRD